MRSRHVVVDPTKDGVIQRRVLFSTVSNYAGKIVALAVGFFLTPFVLHRLGPAAYGLWVLVGSVVAYGALLDFGISSAITKYVAEYHARGAAKDMQSLVATGLLLYSGLGVLALLLSIVLAAIFPLIFSVPPGQHTTAVRLVLLSGVALGISIPCSTPMAVLRGLQRFDLINLINSSATVLYGLTTVAVLTLGGGLLGMVAISIPLTLLVQIPTIWIIHRIAPEVRFGWRGAELRLVRTVASFSGALFVINVSSQIQTETDEIVIGAMMAVASVTPYAIARRLSQMPQILTDQFMKVLLPLASQLHAEQDHGRLRALYLASTRLTLVFYLPLACGIVFLARPFLAVWVGAQYADYSYLAILLVAASLLDTSQWPAGSVLQGMAKHRWLAVMSFGSAIANVTLSVLLIKPLGLLGVALGTLIPTTIQCLFFVLPYAMRINGVSMRTAIMEMFLPAFVPVIPMAAALYGLRELIQPASYVSIALVGGLSLIVYAAGYLSIGASPSERQAIRGLIVNVLQRARARMQQS